jgi:Ca2+-binding RTX toxin-like protein
MAWPAEPQLSDPFGVRSAMTRVVVTAFTIAGLLVAASAANAATAAIEQRDCDRSGCNYFAVFNAGAGETNRVTVSRDPVDGLVLHDDVSPVKPGNACEALDEHTVRCSATKYTSYWCCADINLGDGDDSFSGVRTENINAGPGNDTVMTDSGFIDGGGGRDVLEADRGTITDGDDGSASRPFDSDVMRLDSGGVLKYDTRTSAVAVNLAAGIGGAPGENDIVSGFDVVWGGSGDDELRAGDSPVIFDGKAGDDRLTGSRWKDRISGGPGADVLDGGGGDDLLNPGNLSAGQTATPDDAKRDRLTCGGGNDLVEQAVGDELAGDCERVALFGISGGASDAFILHFPPKRSTALLVSHRPVACTPQESETLTVRLAHRLRGHRAGELLGRKVTRCRTTAMKATLHLAKAGQNLLAMTRGSIPVAISAVYFAGIGQRRATFYAQLR